MNATNLFKNFDYYSFLSLKFIIESSLTFLIDLNLRREFEMGVNLDFGGSVGAARQGFHVRLEDIFAEGDADLRRSGSCDAVAGCDDVPLVH